MDKFRWACGVIAKTITPDVSRSSRWTSNNSGKTTCKRDQTIGQFRTPTRDRKQTSGFIDDNNVGVFMQDDQWVRWGIIRRNHASHLPVKHAGNNAKTRPGLLVLDFGEIFLDFFTKCCTVKKTVIFSRTES